MMRAVQKTYIGIGPSILFLFVLERHAFRMVRSLVLAAAFLVSSAAFAREQEGSLTVPYDLAHNLATAERPRRTFPFLAGPGKDARRTIVTGLGMPASAVGKVFAYRDPEGRNRLIPIVGPCAGVLVDDTHVLTAAHCLRGGGKDDRQLAEQFGFFLDGDPKAWLAYDIVTPGMPRKPVDQRDARYRPIDKAARVQMAADIQNSDFAILRMDSIARYAGGVIPVSKRTPDRLIAERTPIRVIGFPASYDAKPLDRPKVAVLDCHMIRRRSDFVYELDCPTEPGFSGGPAIVAEPDGGWGVVGILLDSDVKHGTSWIHTLWDYGIEDYLEPPRPFPHPK